MFEILTFKFLTPLWLLFLPFAWLVMWLFFRFYQQRSMWEQVVDEHLLTKLIPNYVKAKSGKWLAWVLTIAISLGIIAASGPSWRNQAVPLFESAAARVVVMDLSRSMLAQDIKPTRFKRAIFKARDLIMAQGDGQTALVAFAGAAFVVSPLTDDKKTLLNFLDSLNPGIMPVQGSRIDLSLSVAEKILQASVSRTGQIYVLTDGVSDVQAAIKRAKETADKGNVVSILAFGTLQGGPLKDATGRLVTDDQGKLIIAKVGFEDLQEIANAGSGKYSRMTASHDDINYLLSTHDRAQIDEAVDSKDRTLQLPINDGIWLVWLMLPLALILFRKNIFWAVLIFCFNPITERVYASDWTDVWKNKEQRAFQAYKNSDFAQALTLSSDPQMKGAALYKSKEFEQAESNFALRGSATSLYNRGNALVQLQQFDQAIAAYSQAIEQNPEFESAITNKRLVEEFLKQQQGQQNSQRDKDDQGDESSDDSSDQSESQQSESEQSQSPSGSHDDELQSDSDREQQQQPNQVMPEAPDEESQSELTPEQLAMKEQMQENAQNPESIDRWINRLPDDPSELLRRKFLRDYQRQRQRSQP